MPAPPPEEIRRRGDRRRRRRTVTVAGATFAVVAVVGGGGVWLQGLPADPGPARNADDPAPAVAVDDLRVDVPPAFPLGAGLPDDVATSTEPGWAEGVLPLEACGRAVDPASSGDVHETRGAVFGGVGTSAPAYSRTVATFTDTERASEYLDDVRDAFEECADGAVVGEAEPSLAVPDGDVGLDGSLTVALDAEDGTATAHRLYLVENAVVVSTTVAPGEGRPEGAGTLVGDGQTLDAPVVAALRYYEGEDLPSSPDDPGTEEPTGPSVAPEQLLTVDVLPDASEGRGPWQAISPTDEPTLACEPTGLGVLLAADAEYAEFTATIEPVPGTTPDPDAPVLRDSAINSGVLAFASPEAADEAYGTVTSWLAACDDPVGGRSIEVEDRSPEVVLPDGAEGYWWATTYAAPEACGGASEDGCDAAWFDHQGVALVGSYLVLVSYRELGGPLEPEGMDARMNEILTAAASSAAYGIGG